MTGLFTGLAGYLTGAVNKKPDVAADGTTNSRVLEIFCVDGKNVLRIHMKVSDCVSPFLFFRS